MIEMIVIKILRDLDKIKEDCEYLNIKIDKRNDNWLSTLT